MDTKVGKPLKAIKLTPDKTPAEREAAWKTFRAAQKALAEEAERNGLTSAKLRKILKEIEAERKARRRPR
jgi:hypothetical protein